MRINTRAWFSLTAALHTEVPPSLHSHWMKRKRLYIHWLNQRHVGALSVISLDHS